MGVLLVGLVCCFSVTDYLLRQLDFSRMLRRNVGIVQHSLARHHLHTLCNWLFCINMQLLRWCPSVSASWLDDSLQNLLPITTKVSKFIITQMESELPYWLLVKKLTDTSWSDVWSKEYIVLYIAAGHRTRHPPHRRDKESQPVAPVQMIFWGTIDDQMVADLRCLNSCSESVHYKTR